jgi:hypothetical protein
MEQYSVSEDGNTLIVKYTLEDQVYLSQPYTGQARFMRVDDNTTMYDFDCDAGSDEAHLPKRKDL